MPLEGKIATYVFPRELTIREAEHLLCYLANQTNYYISYNILTEEHKQIVPNDSCTTGSSNTHPTQIHGTILKEDELNLKYCDVETGRGTVMRVDFEFDIRGFENVEALSLGKDSSSWQENERFGKLGFYEFFEKKIKDYFTEDRI